MTNKKTTSEVLKEIVKNETSKTIIFLSGLQEGDTMEAIGFIDSTILKAAKEIAHMIVNDSHCSPDRIKTPNSNNCADYVENWFKENKYETKFSIQNH
ncbi:gp84 [Sphingomonas phage PAU]|uniref:gp84 n=1 Tax=Sphingomonas phage PAU TaxID=1150991 RepID=UPI00025731DE|nr:gp84 [Sphingomonas phage PAU]AFF28082.1 gp84 [Sphingomonas phage PAU]